ncbi:hypothetical protein ACHAXS_014449 [Conticribra weissflogii]
MSLGFSTSSSSSLLEILDRCKAIDAAFSEVFVTSLPGSSNRVIALLMHHTTLACIFFVSALSFCAVSFGHGPVLENPVRGGASTTEPGFSDGIVVSSSGSSITGRCLRFVGHSNSETDFFNAVVIGSFSFLRSLARFGDNDATFPEMFVTSLPGLSLEGRPIRFGERLDSGEISAVVAAIASGTGS